MSIVAKYNTLQGNMGKMYVSFPVLMPLSLSLSWNIYIFKTP